jgi:electron transport complex protein RnfB
VDAIVGARKFMHTILTNACTGCELCLPPCPVDCIDLVAVTQTTGEHWPDYTDAEVSQWRIAAQNRNRRLARRKKQRAAQQTGKTHSLSSSQIRAEIAASVARVRTKRGT